MIPEVLGRAAFRHWVIFGCGIVGRKLRGDYVAPHGAGPSSCSRGVCALLYLAVPSSGP